MEDYRLGAWDILAKILHVEGKTDEALSIYKEYFPNWYNSGEQKSEQLFAKDTDEYYFRVRKNMYELADFAADKLGIMPDHEKIQYYLYLDMLF